MFFAWGDVSCKREKKRKLMDWYGGDRCFADEWKGETSPSPAATDPSTREDGTIDGLESESSEMEVEELGMSASAEEGEEGRRRFGLQKMKRRELPPPMRLVGASRGGLMRAERKEGRLILRQVRTERAPFLHVSREGERLRMYLVDCAPEDEEKATAALPAEEGGERRGWQRRGDLRCNGAVSRGTSAQFRWNHRYTTMVLGRGVVAGDRLTACVEPLSVSFP